VTTAPVVADAKDDGCEIGPDGTGEAISARRMVAGGTEDLPWRR